MSNPRPRPPEARAEQFPDHQIVVVHKSYLVCSSSPRYARFDRALAMLRRAARDSPRNSSLTAANSEIKSSLRRTFLGRAIAFLRRFSSSTPLRHATSSFHDSRLNQGLINFLAIFTLPFYVGLCESSGFLFIASTPMRLSPTGHPSKAYKASTQLPCGYTRDWHHSRYISRSYSFSSQTSM